MTKIDIPQSANSHLKTPKYASTLNKNFTKIHKQLEITIIGPDFQLILYDL